MVEPVLKEDGTPYKVAILIPTINNADELAIVLDRLTQQTYPGIEIVISDSKSRDHTKDVCEKYGATWIEDPSTNRADACNFALKQMDHDLVLFTDDDTIPPLDWAEKLIRWFKDPEVGAVGGPNFAPDEDPFGAKCADVAFCTQFMTVHNLVVNWFQSRTTLVSTALIEWKTFVKSTSSNPDALGLKMSFSMQKSSEKGTNCSSIHPM
jgi:cellulose synthase/poly-beta-1,6-N-acetylglucosamine synthase-like glycosyltransferase